MQPDRAKEIVKSLADGIDPETGVSFPSASPYQRADTVRALYTILEAAESGKTRKPKNPVDPNDLSAVASQRRSEPHAGGRWTQEEEDRLRTAFQAHKTESDTLPLNARASAFADWRRKTAADHGRTTGGITSRLVKLALIEDSPTNRPGQGNRPEAGMSRRSPGIAQTDQVNRPPVASLPRHPTAPSQRPTSQTDPIDPDDCPF